MRELGQLLPFAVVLVVPSNGGNVEEAWHKDTVGHSPLVPTKECAWVLAQKIVDLFQFSSHLVLQLFVSFRITVLSPSWENGEYLTWRKEREENEEESQNRKLSLEIMQCSFFMGCTKLLSVCICMAHQNPGWQHSLHAPHLPYLEIMLKLDGCWMGTVTWKITQP